MHNLSAPTYSPSFLSCILFAKNFQQLIFEPTHKHGSILDLVLTSNPEGLQHLTISNISSHLCKSNHYLIEFELISNCYPRFIYPQLNKCQFGFLESRSCQSQLLSSFSHIYILIDKKNACDVIYLDIKKAFDPVPHNDYSNFGAWA